MDPLKEIANDPRLPEGDAAQRPGHTVGNQFGGE